MDRTNFRLDGLESACFADVLCEFKLCEFAQALNYFTKTEKITRRVLATKAGNAILSVIVNVVFHSSSYLF